ncbi:MAG: hypothetical protein D8B58_01765 [Veillonella sp.]
MNKVYRVVFNVKKGCYTRHSITRTSCRNCCIKSKHDKII